MPNDTDAPATEPTQATFEIHPDFAEQITATRKRMNDAGRARRRLKDEKVAALVKANKEITEQTQIIKVESKNLANFVRDSERALRLGKGA